MSTKTTLAPGSLAFILADLADAARMTASDNQPACSSVCAAVANLIVASGSYGGASQRRVMDAAALAGFRPEYWPGGTVRVTFEGAR